MIKFVYIYLMTKGILKIGNWILLGKNTIGFTFYPFIFIKKSWADHELKENLEKTINHERIHIRQQLELLVLIFYIWYILEFTIRFIIMLNFNKAYEKISFEQEAYINANDFNYLFKRKFWSFLKYL